MYYQCKYELNLLGWGDALMQNYIQRANRLMEKSIMNDMNFFKHFLFLHMLWPRYSFVPQNSMETCNGFSLKAPL